jgi:hypothetical protein
MSPAKRFVLRWSRTLHVYLTILALLLLLFFAATGFMLNHGDWFGLEEVQVATWEGQLPTALLQEPLDRLAIVEKLRADFGATGALDSFEEAEEELRIAFRGPGRQTDAVIQREDGDTHVVCESHGLMGHLTDLHRGQATGAAWSLIIDGFSILLLFVSLTGLVLWISLQRRRRLGLIILTLSFVVCAGVYLMFVP